MADDESKSPTPAEETSATRPDSELTLTQSFARLVFGLAGVAMAWCSLGSCAALVFSSGPDSDRLWTAFLFCGWVYCIGSFRCFRWTEPAALIVAALFLNGIAALGFIPFVGGIHDLTPPLWCLLGLPLMWILVIRSAILSTAAKDDKPSAAANDRSHPWRPTWKTRRWGLVILGLAAFFMVGFSVIGFNTILYPIGSESTQWGLFLFCGWFYIIGSFLSFYRQKSPSRLIASATSLHGIAALGFFPLVAHTRNLSPALLCVLILPLTWFLVILNARKAAKWQL